MSSEKPDYVPEGCTYFGPERIKSEHHPAIGDEHLVLLVGIDGTDRDHTRPVSEDEIASLVIRRDQVEKAVSDILRDHSQTQLHRIYDGIRTPALADEIVHPNKSPNTIREYLASIDQFFLTTTN